MGISDHPLRLTLIPVSVAEAYMHGDFDATSSDVKNTLDVSVRRTVADDIR